MLCENGLNFSRFNTVAPQLHLLVEPAHARLIEGGLSDGLRVRQGLFPDRRNDAPALLE